MSPNSLNVQTIDVSEEQSDIQARIMIHLSKSTFVMIKITSNYLCNYVGDLLKTLNSQL